MRLDVRRARALLGLQRAAAIERRERYRRYV